MSKLVGVITTAMFIFMCYIVWTKDLVVKCTDYVTIAEVYAYSYTGGGHLRETLSVDTEGIKRKLQGAYVVGEAVCLHYDRYWKDTK